MLENYYISTKVLTNVSTYGSFLFVRSWDAILQMYTSLNKVFRDGTQIPISTITSSNYHVYISMSGGKVAYMGTSYKTLYRTCQFTMQPILTSLISEHEFSGSNLGPGDYIDEERKLVFHRTSNGRIAKVYHLDTGELLKTITLTTSSAVFYYHYAGNGRFCAIGVNGHVIIYDYVGWEIVQYSLLGMNILTGTYDCNCNIIIAVNSTYHIYVFGLDDSGNGLSVPVFSPTGNKYLYSGYRLSTRLTGQGGTPIANAWINWELLGIKGTLEKAYSLTDANGYAWNYYWCPTDVSQIGSETVRVWYEQ